MRISDWSSDVCSSDLLAAAVQISACRHSRGTVRRPAMTRWYVAQTQAQGEERARLNLERQGFRTYLPRYRRERRHARRRDVVQAPLFPGYIFIELDLEQSPWRSINEIGRAHVELQSLMRISYAVFDFK